MEQNPQEGLLNFQEEQQLQSASSAVEGFRQGCCTRRKDSLNGCRRRLRAKYVDLKSHRCVNLTIRAVKMGLSFWSEGKDWYLLYKLLSNNQLCWVLVACPVHFISYGVRGYRFRRLQLKDWQPWKAVVTCWASLPFSILELHFWDLVLLPLHFSRAVHEVLRQCVNFCMESLKGCGTERCKKVLTGCGIERCSMCCVKVLNRCTERCKKCCLKVLKRCGMERCSMCCLKACDCVSLGLNFFQRPEAEEEHAQWTYVRLREIMQAKWGKPLRALLELTFLVVDLNPFNLWPDLDQRLFGKSLELGLPFLAFAFCTSVISFCSQLDFTTYYAALLAAKLKTGTSTEAFMEKMYLLGKGMPRTDIFDSVRIEKEVEVTYNMDLDADGALAFARAVASSDVLKKLTLHHCDFMKKLEKRILHNFMILLFGCRTLETLCLVGAELPKDVAEDVEAARHRHHSFQVLSFNAPGAARPAPEADGTPKEPRPRAFGTLLDGAWDGDLAKVQLCIQNSAGPEADVLKVKTPDKCGGFTALHLAAIRGHLDVLRCLLLAPGVLAHCTNTCACERGSDGCPLLEDGYSATPLFWAAHEGWVHLVQLLLLAGLKPNQGDAGGHTPARMAAQYNKVAVLDVLLSEGADPNVADDSGRTPLHMAAQEGHVEAIETLLHFRANVEGRQVPLSPLPPAPSCCRRCVEAAIQKLWGRVETQAGDLEGNTQAGAKVPSPLHSATSTGHLKCAEALLKAKADVASLDPDDGSTCLHVAGRIGHVGLVQLLMEHRGDPNATRTERASNASSSSNSPRCTHITPLLEAVRGLHPACVSAMLEGECSEESLQSALQEAQGLPAALKRAQQKHQACHMILSLVMAHPSQDQNSTEELHAAVDSVSTSRVRDRLAKGDAVDGQLRRLGEEKLQSAASKLQRMEAGMPLLPEVLSLLQKATKRPQPSGAGAAMPLMEHRV